MDLPSSASVKWIVPEIAAIVVVVGAMTVVALVDPVVDPVVETVVATDVEVVDDVEDDVEVVVAVETERPAPQAASNAQTAIRAGATIGSRLVTRHSRVPAPPSIVGGAHPQVLHQRAGNLAPRRIRSW
jgi:hypothetical protein